MPRTARKAPDFAYITALADELTALYFDQDRQIERARAVREMSVPALNGVDDKYVLVNVDPRDPAVADEAFRELASLSLQRPALTVMHEGDESDAAEDNATLREHWTEQTLWTCGTREAGADTMRDIMDAALFDGGGWAKLLWMRDRWDQRYQVDKTLADDEYTTAAEEAKKAAGPPFAWVHVDAATIYPVWGGGELCEVLEITERPLRSTLRRYGLATDASGNIVPEDLGQPMSTTQGAKLATSVKVYEHWDETFATYAVVGINGDGQRTGQVVKQLRHGYRFGVPYDFAPGLWMNHWKNRKVGWGIAETKRWLVEYRQYLRAMHAQYVARDLLSPLVTEGEDAGSLVIGDDGKPTTREDGPEPGSIVHLPGGRELKRIEYPDASTLEKHIVLIDGAIEKLESPRVNDLNGLEGAGFAISQVLSYERVKVGPVCNSVQELLKRQTLKLWELVKSKAKETVYVESDNNRSGYLGLGPEDLSKARRIVWEVKTERATDDLVKARYAHERKNNGTWGEDEAITFLGDNPDEVRRSKARDRIRASKAYQMWQDEVVFAKAGRGDILAKAAEAEKLATSGMLPEQALAMQQSGINPAMLSAAGGAGMGVGPDQGALATAPNGAGAALQGPPNGSVPGAGPGAVVPSQGAAGGVQSLGI